MENEYTDERCGTCRHCVVPDNFDYEYYCNKWSSITVYVQDECEEYEYE